MRTRSAVYMLVCLSFFLWASAFGLQVLQVNKFRQLSDKNCIRLVPQAGARGRIIDREGRVIVEDILSYDAMVMPEEGGLPRKSILKISGILGRDYDGLIAAFRRNYRGSSIPVTVAKDIDRQQGIILEELKDQIPGVMVQQLPQRYYPGGGLASHVLGYLSEIDRWRLTLLADYGYKTKDYVGFGGVEEKYDYYLRQEEGGLSVEVDHRGAFKRVIGFKSPKNGVDLQLTLDSGIQKITEDCLKGRRGAVVIMDPRNGAVLALASSPGFNPAVFVKRRGLAISQLFSDQDAPLLDRAVAGSYPPASVFKVVVACAALETGKINPQTVFYCPGWMHIGNRNFACWEKHEAEGLTAAIAHSCDVFFYHTGLLLGPQALHDWAVKFGLGRRTSIDLPYESEGFVSSPLWKRLSRLQGWYDGDTANFSIGQGELLVTPLQACRMMAVFANGGNLVRPFIVKSINEKPLEDYQRKIIRLPIKSSTLAYVNQGLRRAVTDPSGTAHILSATGTDVAGKTGTAQASGGPAHAWFCGFFPYKEPRFAVCVFLERGGSGAAACSLAGQIIEKMLKDGL